MKQTRSLSGLFCDDIRQEINGKISLIGCYNDKMLVEKFPVTLAKMCAHVRVATDSSEPFQSVKLVVLLGDTVLLEGELPLDPTALQSVSTELPEGKTQAVMVQLVLAPLVLEAPCSLRVRAIVDGKEMRGLGMAIEQLVGESAAELAATVRPPMPQSSTLSS